MCRRSPEQMPNREMTLYGTLLPAQRPSVVRATGYPGAGAEDRASGSRYDSHVPKLRRPALGREGALECTGFRCAPQAVLLMSVVRVLTIAVRSPITAMTRPLGRLIGQVDPQEEERPPRRSFATGGVELVEAFPRERPLRLFAWCGGAVRRRKRRDTQQRGKIVLPGAPDSRLNSTSRQPKTL